MHTYKAIGIENNRISLLKVRQRLMHHFRPNPSKKKKKRKRKRKEQTC